METQADVLEAQTISHRHASGEIYEAHNIESAYVQCTGLAGKISLEEFGLLLELEAIGKEEVTNDPPVRTEKPVIKRIEKQPPSVNENPNIPVAVTPPITPEATHTPNAYIATFEDIILPKPQQLIEEQHIEGDAKGSEEEIRVITQLMEIPSADAADKLHGSSGTTETAIIHKPVPTETDSDSQELQHYIPETSPEDVSESVAVTETNHDLPAPAHESSLDLSDNTGTTDVEAISEYEFIAADHDDTETVEIAKLVTEISDETAIIAPDDIVTFTNGDTTERLLRIPDEDMLVSLTPELPAPLLQVETALTSVVEAMEGADKEQIEIAQQIFQEIMNLPMEAEYWNEDKEDDLEQKLEEQFTELFENLGIDYSPELLTSLARVTRTHYLDNVMELIQQSEDEMPTLPDDIGTREFLQHLQHVLVVVQQTTVRFCELGKSVLKLCNQNRSLAVS